ncbi:Tautomerase/MIF [Mycena crocata]|nr:Tautomerase/MIF [Mycena crocata]
MPMANLVTNVKAIEDIKQFSLALSRACSEGWGLDDPDGSRTSGSVIYDASLNFNGTHEPAFQLKFTIIPIGDAGTEKRDAFAKALCTFLERELGIPQSRGYM